MLHGNKTTPGSTVSKSMPIRIQATRSPLSLITKALSALPKPHLSLKGSACAPQPPHRGSSALPCPTLRTPAQATSRKHIPDNTRPGFPSRPLGHQHITPPRKHSANTHGGRAGAGPGDTPTRWGTAGQALTWSAGSALPIRLHLPAFAEDKLLQTPAAPSALRGSVQTTEQTLPPALRGPPSPGAAHSTTRGSSAQAPSPLTQPSTPSPGPYRWMRVTRARASPKGSQRSGSEERRAGDEVPSEARETPSFSGR